MLNWTIMQVVYTKVNSGTNNTWFHDVDYAPSNPINTIYLDRLWGFIYIKTCREPLCLIQELQLIPGLAAIFLRGGKLRTSKLNKPSNWRTNIYGHGTCLWVSHNALFSKSQTYPINDSIYYFDWVFLEIPVKNCIVGMLLTCPIVSHFCLTLFHIWP